ncbi:MAG: family 1 glycosylhydrolase [Eubacterium sp.]|nr:family 1 glycosylhydrolase [Eubacterium sp.]
MAFQDDFMWGAATCAYQVEGAFDEDGKGPSMWDALSDGHVAHGDSGRVSCDHYHHFREDIDIMKRIGLKAYRFSVSWPRVMPEDGVINEKGLSFYKDLVSALTDAGIEPLCTLYHWDLPMWSYRKGGWMDDSVSDDFADFVSVVVSALSDKVSYWMTFNEGTSFLGEGYLHGTHPPYETVERGSEEEKEKIIKLSRNLLLAHGKAVKVIRDNAVLTPKIGIATDSTLYIPDSEDPSDIEHARAMTFADKVDHYLLSWWLDPILSGTGNRRLMESMSDEEKDLIHRPLDFIGWNCYLANNYNDGPDGKMMKYWPGIPRTNSGFAVTPDALYWGVKFIYERYHLPIMITENGAAITDFVFDDGHVHDPQRIQFLKWYLRGLKRAVDEGFPVIGYMLWSLLDNFEWAFGYDKRFGLVYVDFRSQKRILKDSAYWYAELIKTNGEDL